ncbi:hypothetical protein HWV62_27504, partial [Athelia sp. TMB]
HRELRVVGEHEINEVWEDDLALKVHAILDAKHVVWSSTEVVRIGNIEEPSGDVILWIGVRPESLSHEVGFGVALECKRLLVGYNIKDVDVEIRESEVIPSAGPSLLKPISASDPIAEAREPFTGTLGITICSRSTPWAEGTGGFFLSEGGGSKKLLLVTARHVVFPPNEDNEENNNLFERKSDSQRHDVLVLSDASFKEHLTSIQAKIREHESTIEYENRCIARKPEEDDDEDEEEVEKQRKHSQSLLEKAEASIFALNTFQHELSVSWATEQSRILGHVIFAPPIVAGVGAEQHTQDVAVIEIDASKIDPSSFPGNAIDLRTKFSPGVLMRMMPQNPRSTTNFKYPLNHLLSLRGTITDDEMRRPTTYDQQNVPCIMVLKRGRTTGLTVGRANNLFSYVRNHFGDNVSAVSKEWAILPFGGIRAFPGPNPSIFSETGDSGAVVVDGAGRIGGLLTCGSGAKDAFDLSYATPISFVLKAIRSNKLLAKAYPKSGPSSAY